MQKSFVITYPDPHLLAGEQ